MSDTNLLLLVVFGSVAVALVVAWLLVRTARTKADALLTEVGAPTRTIAATALGTTDESDGALTGTGTLVLTASELAFAQWRPSKLFRIPRSDIVKVDTTREHLGKSMRSDVLRVAWRHAGAEHDVAFFVRDVDPWLADLGGQRGSTNT